MIGDFEIPGSSDPDAKSSRVGGNPPDQPPPPGGASETDPSNQKGGQSASQSPNQPAAAGGAAAASADPQANGAGSKADPNAANSPGGAGAQGPNDPDAKNGAVQVAGITNDGSGDKTGESSSGGKPPPIAIGDSTMAIKAIGPPPPAITGATQTGGATSQSIVPGAKGASPTNSGGGGRNGTDKGRTLPPGL